MTTTIPNKAITSKSSQRAITTNGVSIAFLGPDGSGKSTIISGLLAQDLPFERHDYFHLKPIPQQPGANKGTVENPHQDPPYGFLKSLVKLGLFILQYNLGWFRNIVPLKKKSSLIIFDRYYDDLLVDHKRYRYGGGKVVAKFVRRIIRRPELYFVLTAEATVIYQRKQEVPFEELERQISGYRNLVDNKRYHAIDVDRSPAQIVKEVTTLLMQHLDERI